VGTCICAGCGCFEHYVADPDKLGEVAGSWGRIEPG
jgi:hypothetical protein